MCIASIALVKMPYLLFSFILHETTLVSNYQITVTVVTVHRQCHLVNDGGRREGNKMLRRHAPAPKKRSGH